MLGYFGDQAATESSFNSDGWFMTGDLGRHDEQGYLHITGRMKDMIIRGGHNINPGRIEDFVMQHEAIERAAVFPISDERLGERICLAVMFRQGKSATPGQILDFIDAAGLTRYEIPEYFVALSEFPIMSNGKIRKPDLVARVRSGEIVPQSVRWQGT
jgi:acyl-CoA synthetase